MTEAEAKTKWCPFVRHSTQNHTNGGADPGINRYSTGIFDYKLDDGVAADVAWNKCIGSACMAWRWDWDDDGMRSNAERKSGASKVGFCGLAGKP